MTTSDTPEIHDYALADFYKNLKPAPLDLVVLIDDDPATNYVHRLLIQELNLSKRVEYFENPVDAVHFLQSSWATEGIVPELILLDLNMPEMDGFELLEELYLSQSNEVPRSSCIIMLTGSMNPDDQRRARKTEFIDYFLTKRLTPKSLSSAIRNVLPNIQIPDGLY